MQSDISILIYQSQDEINHLSFKNKFVGWLSEAYPHIPSLHVDSFSGSEMFNYAGQIFENSRFTLFITLFDHSANITGLIPLIRKSNNHRDVTFASLGWHNILDIIHKSPRKFQGMNELRDFVTGWIQARLNESESA